MDGWMGCGLDSRFRQRKGREDIYHECIVLDE